MVRKEKLAVFESSSISEIEKATPTNIGVHVFGINPYLHKIFWADSNWFIFLRSMVQKGNLAKFE